MRSGRRAGRLAWAVLLGGLGVWLAPAWGGSVHYDFDAAPAADLEFVGHATWRPSGGVNDSGYMSLFDAVNSQRAAVLIPDFDQGGVLKSFTFEVDLRIGNGVGNGGRPADGFSISYAGADDPVVQDLMLGIDNPNMFAAAGLPESGTRTGLAVGFDTWAGNQLPDGPDIEGIIVRVDNVTKARIPMPTRNGACADATSLQTGPWDGADTGAPTGLCWAPLKVVLTEDGELTVRWKNVDVVSALPTGFVPMAGRIVFAGRTGGANENTHIDNLRVTTSAMDRAWLSRVIAAADGYTLFIRDAGSSVYKAGSAAITIDQQAVVPTATSQAGGVTTLRVQTAPGSLLPGSVHTVEVAFEDTLGQVLRGSRGVTVGPYRLVPGSYAATEVDPASRGLNVRVHQLRFRRGPGDVNTLVNAEEQMGGGFVDPLTGLAAANVADLAGSDLAGVIRVETVNWSKEGGAYEGENFTSRWPNAAPRPNDFIPGIPGTTGSGDQAVAEVTAYLELAAGAYRMGVNSDDGFLVSVAPGEGELMGLELGRFETGRAVADTLFDFAVEQPGFYPFRLLWWQGDGGAAVEWFLENLVTGERVLVNDPAHPRAVKAYARGRAAAALRALTPYPGKRGVEPRPTVRAVLEDGVAPIDPASVQLRIDGQTVNPTLSKTGAQTTILWTPAVPFAMRSSHTGVLQFADTATPARARTVDLGFEVRPAGAGDLPLTSFVVELEDFDFDGGQFKPEANSRPYLGGAYAGLSAVPDVDYHYVNAESSGDEYRLGEVPNVPMTSNLDGGTDDALRPGYEVTVNYRLGWIADGSWQNYTRDFPVDTYRVYAAMSHNDTTPHMLRGSLDKVVSGVGTVAQTVERLGDFDAPGSGNWGGNHLVPLVDADGEPVLLSLGGRTTLRFNQGSGDVDWLVFAPVNVGELPSLTRQPTGQVAGLGRTVTFEVEAAGTGPFVYRWRRNGELLQDDGRVSGALTGTLTVANLQATDEGEYYVTVSNNAGTVRSLTVTLEVPRAAAVVAWGNNGAGQINVPAGLNEVAALAAGGAFSYALKRDGTPVGWGTSQSGETPAPAGLGAVGMLSAGDGHVLAVRPDGTVASWGWGVPSVLTPPPGLANVSAVSGGAEHSLALKSDGTVVAWGKDEWGQTRVPAGLSGVVAVSAGGWHSVALRADGTVVAWGKNDQGQCSGLAGLTEVVAISARWDGTLALLANGRLVGCGNPGSPPMAIADGLAIASGNNHAAVLRSSGRVYVWGHRGNDAPSGLRNVVALAAGGDHLLALARGNLEGERPVITGPRYWLGAVDRSFRLPLLAGTLVTAWSASGLPPGLAIDPTTGVVSGTPTQPGLYDAVVTAANSTGSDQAPLRLSILNPVPRFLVADTVQAHPGLPLRYGVPALHNPTGVTVTGLPAGLAYDASSLSITGTPPATVGLFPVTVTGQNAYGQGQTEFKLSLQTIMARGANLYRQHFPPAGLKGIVELKGNWANLAALREDGRVVVWGRGAEDDARVPGDLANVVSVAVGDAYRLALIADGRVRMWRAGVDVTVPELVGVSNVVAVSTAGSHWLVLRQDGTLLTGGQISTGAARVPEDLVDVVAIASGWDFDVALRRNGTVRAWGGNGAGELNVPSFPDRVVAVAAGGHHGLALSESGTVVAWGWNSDGQTQVPAEARQAVWIEAWAHASMALKPDGTMVVWGRSAEGQREFPANPGPVVDVASGAGDNYALLAVEPDTSAPFLAVPPLLVGGAEGVFRYPVRAKNGPVTYGATGLPAGLAIDPASGLIAGTPTEPGNYAVVLEATNGAGTTRKTVRLAILGSPGFIQQPSSQGVMAGGSVTLSAAVTGPGTLTYQWEFNGQPIPGATGLSLAVGNVDAAKEGYYRLRASNSAGTVLSRPAAVVLRQVPPNLYTMSWGGCGWGECGVPDDLRTNLMGFSANYSHQLAIRGDTTVGGWGMNDGNALDIPPGLVGVRQVAAGNGFSMALKVDGTVAVWGRNDFGQRDVPAGLSEVTAIAAGYGHCVALRKDGRVVAWGLNSEGQSTVPPGLTGMTAIAAGENFTMALRANGTVLVWGTDGWGLKQVPAGVVNVVAIAAVSNFCLALKADGTVAAWGNSDFGAPNVPAGLDRVVAIAAGRYHGLALRADGSLAAWGAGVGAPLYNYNPFTGQSAVPAGLSGVQAIAGGQNHSMVLFHGPPAIWTSPASHRVTTGGEVEFWNRAEGPGPLSYQWYFNDAPIFSATNRTLKVTNIGAAQVGRYQVVVASPLGATSSRVAELSLNDGLPGSVDLAFRPNPGADGPVDELLALPNGQFVLAGRFARYNGAPANRLVRINPDATRDPSFLNNLSGPDNSIDGLLLMPDGRLLVWGSFMTFNGVGRARLVRLLSDGNVDATFNVPGSGFDGWVYDAALQADGKVVVVGQFMNVDGIRRARIARLLADGSLDTGFTVGTGPEGEVWRVIVQPNGRILVGGGFHLINGVVRAGVARLTASGALEAQVSGFGWLADLALQADGKIVVAGVLELPNRGKRFLARLNADGTLDTGFYPVSTGAYPLGPDDGGGLRLWPLPDGKLLVAGIFERFNGEPRQRLVRLHADGTLDAAFDVATLNPPSDRAGGNTAGRVSALALGPDNTYVIGGETFDRASGYERWNLARIHAGSVPRILSHPASLVAIQGQDAAFGVSATNPAPMTYQWQFNNTDLPGATNSNLRLTGVQPAQGGAYRVLVRNVMGTATSEAALLTVLVPPSITQQPRTQIAKAGTDAVLSVTVSGTAPFSYQWQRDEIDLVGQTGATLTLSAIQFGQGGRYRVKIANGAGAVTSDPIELQVYMGDGYLYRWLYGGIGGSSVFDLTLNGAFPAAPSGIEKLTNGFEASFNVDDAYGSFIQGFVTAPVTGDYRFWIAADEAAELWLSSDESAANLGIAAWCDSPVPRGSWTARPEQQSLPIRLESGKRYYLETFHKENVGEDHLAVGWTLPDGTVQRPIPAGFLSPLNDPITAPTIQQPPASLALIAGEQAVFSVTADGVPPLNYQWQWQGVDLPGATSATLVLNNVQAEQAGQYRVVVKNRFGEATSAPATLTVSYALTATATAGGEVRRTPALPSYAPGTQVELVPVAQAGFVFTGWSQDATGTANPLMVTLDRNLTIVARFTPVWSLTLAQNSGGVVSKDPDQASYLHGTAVTVRAVPAPGYIFVGWSEDGSGTDNPLVVTLDRNKTVRATFQRVFTLTLTQAGEGNLAVDPAKAHYGLGEVVKVTAVPGGAYGFSHWSGDLTGTNPVVSVTMTADKRLTANFKLWRTLALTVSGQGVIGADPLAAQYLDGTSVRLTATPSAGWSFVEWREGLTGATNPATLVLDATKAVTAVFRQLFVVTTNVVGKGAIQLSPKQTSYLDGTTVTVAAIAASGQRFTGWTGDLSGTNNPTLLTVNGPKTVTATFVPVWELTVTSSTGGTVTREPNLTNYLDGTVVALSPVAEAGYAFKSWTGDASGSAVPLLVTLNAPKSIQANFVRTYTLATTVNGGGRLKIEPFKERYEAGESVQIAAEADAGYGFAGWSGASSATTPTLTLAMDANKTLTATFKRLRALSLIAQGQGTLIGVPAGTNFLDGTTVQVSATPGNGWQFVGWQGAVTNAVNPVALAMDADKELVGVFKQLFTVATTVNGRGTVRLSPDQTTYLEGAVVTVTASAPSGSAFLNWGGDLSGTNNPVTLTVTTNKSVIGNFVSVWTLTATAGTGGRILKNPDLSRYNDGTVVMLTAEADPTFAFKAWSGDLTGNTNPVPLAMNGNKAVGATFAPAVFLTSSFTGEGAVDVAPLKDRYAQGDVVQVTARPAVGWAFVNWSGASASTNATLSLTLDSSKSLTANFKPWRTLRVDILGLGSVSRTPNLSEYVAGTSVRLTAVASNDWQFAEWRGPVSGTQNPLDYVVTTNVEIAAVFRPLFVVTTGTNGPGSVVLTPTQARYLDGSVITATAVPLAGQRFTGWSGDLGGTNNPATLLVDTNKQVVANFVPGWKLLTEAGAGGRIERSPDLGEYGDHVTVRLTAKPNLGYTFVNWAGAVTGTNNPVNLAMTTNLAVQAFFTNVWTLITTANAGGSVTREPNRTEYLTGAQVKLTATANSGYVFAGWSGDASGNVNPLTVTMDRNRTITASFKAGELVPPLVRIESPTAGTVADERFVLRGTATDNTSIAFLRWEWNGEARGAIPAIDGRFQVAGLRLRAGENRLRVEAEDPSGNKAADEVTVTWVPARTFTVVSAVEQQEGKRVIFPVQLTSQGEVGGMSFVLRYDPEYLRDPQFTWSGTVGGSVNQVNTEVVGEVKATFSLPATAVPTGTQALAEASFRARSVPFRLETELTAEVLDVAEPSGNRLLFGTAIEQGTARILPRRMLGDINANQRQDIGDATLIQRLVAGLEPARTWDVTGNDLNASGDLDSGDVIRVLRVVVGIDPQPTLGPGLHGFAISDFRFRIADSSPVTRPSSLDLGLSLATLGATSTNEAALLLPAQQPGLAGQLVTYRVVLTNVSSGIAGVALSLEYPTNALRLVDGTSHRVGTLVPASAVKIWNVAPAQNNYLVQTGKVSLAASSASVWPERDGVVAEFTFQVQASAMGQTSWPIRLGGVELTSDGFEVRTLPEVVALLTTGTGPTPQPVTLDGGASGLKADGFHVVFGAVVGARYEIEASGNLEAWTVVGTVTASGTRVDEVVPLVAGEKVRFYRVRSL